MTKKKGQKVITIAGTHIEQIPQIISGFWRLCKETIKRKISYLYQLEISKEKYKGKRLKERSQKWRKSENEQTGINALMTEK